MTMSIFTGFSRETTRFLAELGKNNSKSWFDEHRDEYERYYITPAKEFVEAVGPALREISPDVQAQPRVNGSIFRVNRDVRFSKDKTPYRDHIDMWFWDGEGRSSAISGFYLRIAATEVIVGAGAHGMDSDRLKQYRSAVADVGSGAQLVTAIAEAEAAGYSVGGAHYKRLPKGYENADEATGKLLRHNALFIDATVSTPEELRSDAFLDFCIAHWKKMSPVHRWLVDNLQTG
jgi:uncharacterized protein (TIGR02453 family)